jgi:hypothetical protein
MEWLCALLWLERQKKTAKAKKYLQEKRIITAKERKCCDKNEKHGENLLTV